MQRIENARNAFFDEESFDTNNFLSFRMEDAHLQSEKFRDCTPKNNTLETVLKQVFLFFPGTFILYILSMAFTAVFITTFTRQLRGNFLYELIFPASLFLAATLMTWLGLGNVRKPKHFIIPASIIGVGVFFGAIAGILMVVSNNFTRLIFENGLPFYIFPLALIVPFLAKGWVETDS